MTKQIKYLFVALFAVIFSFMIHEFAHWLMGESLGYKMGMSLNKAYPLAGGYLRDSHYTIISAVGPAVTLLQTVFFFILIKLYRNYFLYPFLFAGAFLETLSGVMNYRHANDLGRISENFDLGIFTIPAIAVAIHLYLLYRTSKREKYSGNQIMWTFLLVLTFSSVWILLNNRYNIQILP